MYKFEKMVAAYDTYEVDLRLNMSVSLRVGELFLNFNSLMSNIEHCQNTSHVQLHRCNSRTVGKAAARCPKKTLSPDLKYAELTFSCIHGGKYFKSEGTGK